MMILITNITAYRMKCSHLYSHMMPYLLLSNSLKLSGLLLILFDLCTTLFNSVDKARKQVEVVKYADRLGNQC